MSGELRFDGRVVLVTGAGNGLGKAYALEFARRGAKVVVNDLGVTARGEGKDNKAADAVVNEIKAAGGAAVADYNSVVEGAKIVKTAIDAFGKVDVIINNAGILRDVSFAKMTDQDWKLLNDVHLSGAYTVAKAAWDGMRERKYGRIINVSSAAGLYGNFGQAHYSAVKMGIVGLSNTLAIEGKKLNIQCNVIAPVAGSRMTETIMPPDLVKALKPEYVSPLVLYLCHDSCKETGGIFEVGAGWMSKLRWERTKGHLFPLNESFTPDLVRDSFSKITDFSVEPQYPTSPQDAFGQIMANLEAAKSGASPASTQSSPSPSASSSSTGGSTVRVRGLGGAAASSTPAAAAKPATGSKGGKKPKKDSDTSVDPALVLAHKFHDTTFAYTEKDAILYALGVGAAASEPTSDAELKYTYEGHPDFGVLPTFGVVAAGNILLEIMTINGLKFNPMMLLHGEQYLEVRKPIATRGTLTNKNKVAGIYDKGKGALLLLDVTSQDSAGEDVFFNQYSLFIRGAGGFGGPQNTPPPTNDPPQRPPDVVHRESSTDSQALLYRLAGDINPLHADPAMASMGGFNKPILHGLCSFGFAVRAVIKHFANNDVSLFKSVRVRFVKHVFPGETLITEMWKVSPTKIIFRVKVAERGEYVLGNAAVELRGAAGSDTPATATVETKAAAVVSGAPFKAEPVFAELKKRADPELVKKVGASYRFDLSSSGTTRSWLVDLKNGAGSVAEVKSDTPADCAIGISDADFVELMAGKLNAQNAFMKGQIKIKGNMMLAQKLRLLSSAPAAKL